MHGLTTKVRKNLIKADICLKEVIKLNDEYSQPYYTRLIYKIQK